jgi:hypothetical protein
MMGETPTINPIVGGIMVAFYIFAFIMSLVTDDKPCCNNPDYYDPGWPQIPYCKNCGK